MPKKIPQQVARDLARLGEEVIKETVRQPAELVRTVGEQLGFMPRNWGEREQKKGITPQIVKDKEEERRKELTMARRRIKELMPKPYHPKPEVTEEQIEEQKRLTKEAEEKKEVPEVPGKKQRGSALLSLRRKKHRGTSEIRGGL